MSENTGASRTVKAGAVEFRRGKIEGVVVRDLKKFVDERGWLSELFRHDELEEEFYPAMADSGVLAGPVDGVRVDRRARHGGHLHVTSVGR